MARSRHRSGRPYREAKALMHAFYGYTCVHCGHGGAGEADHLDPISMYPDQPIDWRRMRPSHGSNYPCPRCPWRGGRGMPCNQVRGTEPIRPTFAPRIAW